MYQHGKRTKLPRNKSVFFFTVMFIGVLVLIGWYIVHKDIGNAPKPSTTVPIISEVGLEGDQEKLKIDEHLFSMELPVDWKLLERRKDPPQVDAYIWISTKKGADDRRLTLYIDYLPKEYKLVRMQPLISNGDTFMVGNVSGNCINFANTKDQSSTTPIPAKWENITFVCDPIVANQSTGTGTPGGTIGTKLKSTRGEHTYFFFYEDHNIHPDDTILRSVLQSFKVK